MILQLMREGLLSDITPRFKYGKIATEEEAANIGGGIGAVSKKCCTKSRAVELGCQVSGTYSNNQLVQQSDLSAPRVQWTIELMYIGTSQDTRGSFTLTGNKGTEIHCLFRVKGKIATVTSGSPFEALVGEEEFTLSYSHSVFNLELYKIDKSNNIINIYVYYNA